MPPALRWLLGCRVGPCWACPAGPVFTSPSSRVREDTPSEARLTCAAPTLCATMPWLLPPLWVPRRGARSVIRRKLATKKSGGCGGEHCASRDELGVYRWGTRKSGPALIGQEAGRAGRHLQMGGGVRGGACEVVWASVLVGHVHRHGDCSPACRPRSRRRHGLRNGACGSASRQPLVAWAAQGALEASACPRGALGMALQNA